MRAVVVLFGFLLLVSAPPDTGAAPMQLTREARLTAVTHSDESPAVSSRADGTVPTAPSPQRVSWSERPETIASGVAPRPIDAPRARRRPHWRRIVRVRTDDSVEH